MVSGLWLMELNCGNGGLLYSFGNQPTGEVNNTAPDLSTPSVGVYQVDPSTNILLRRGVLMGSSRLEKTICITGRES